MRRIGMVIGIVAIVAGMSATAFAGDFKLSISIVLGRPTVYRPPVVVYQPAPQVVYQQAPVVVYQPAPVVYQPVVMTPPPVVMYPPNPNRVVCVQAPLVVSPPVYRLPTVATQPVFRPMGRPVQNDSRFTAQRDRDDDSFSHGRTTYQPVARPGGSVYYRQIRNNH
jgi:hypothetical protein